MQGIVFELRSGSNRADDHVAGTVFGRDTQPAQHGFLAAAGRSAKPVQQDMIKLQSFCPVHRHDLQATVAACWA